MNSCHNEAIGTSIMLHFNVSDLTIMIMLHTEQKIISVYVSVNISDSLSSFHVIMSY